MNIPTFLRDVNINRQLTEEDIRYNKLCEKAKKDREARLKETKKILFGYMQSPSYGEMAEDDGGFSIDVYKDGRVVYKTYIFHGIEKITEVFYVSKKIISSIKKILEDNAHQIEDLERNIDNGSCDGDMNNFIFKGKSVLVCNIDYSNEEFVKNQNINYYNKYLKEIRQQNFILDIFIRIQKVLNDGGIKLNLYHVSFDLYNRK